MLTGSRCKRCFLQESCICQQCDPSSIVYISKIKIVDMGGLFLQQYYLPFFEPLFADNDHFLASKLDCLRPPWLGNKRNKKEESSSSSKSKLLGFGVKSSKYDNGNATFAEVQELLSNSKILSIKWKSSSCITIILADGTIIYVHLKNIHTSEFYYVVDRYFKFPESASTVAYSSKHVLFMFSENRLLLLRKNDNEEDGNSKTDLIQPEVTVNHYQDLLPSLASKKAEKRVSINSTSDLFMVWWTGSKDDVFPWTPKPEQRANILIYSLDENDPELVSFLKTDNNLLECSFVHGNYNHVITLEESNDSQGNVIVNEIIHEITRGKLTPVCETSIPLQSQLKCFAYDEKCRKLGLGCCDGSVVIYTQDKKITHFTKASFLPWSVTWHNDGYLLFVAGERGQFQIFDIALIPLLLMDNLDRSPSLTKQLIPSSNVSHMCWMPLQRNSTDSFLLIRFESGVLVMLRLAIGRFRLMQLCDFHLANDHWPEAVKVLKSVSWNSDECLYATYKIYAFLMQRPYSEEIEYNLEHLLATYFAPSTEIDESMKKRHAKSMRILAKKFFMWLVREKHYSRAFQIAISLNEEGLLRKLQIIAVSHGEVGLVAEINKKLKQFELSSSGSSDSFDSDSQSYASYSSTSQSSADVDHQGPFRQVSVSIPRPELLVLEPPSPYKNSTTVIEPPKPPNPFFFGVDENSENWSGNHMTSLPSNALISESGETEVGAVMGRSSSSTIEVINFGLV